MLTVRETIDKLGGTKAVAEALKDEFGEPKAPTVGMWAVRNRVPNRWKPKLRKLAGHAFDETPSDVPSVAHSHQLDRKDNQGFPEGVRPPPGMHEDDGGEAA